MNLLFPPQCLHCEAYGEHPFCSICSEQLTLLKPEHRCARCFAEKKASRCKCTESPYPIDALAAPFERFGPAMELVQLLKRRPAVARSVAAFMALQLEQLEWNKIDTLIPMPLHWLHQFDRGFNQSKLVAYELSRLIGAPVSGCLRRKFRPRQESFTMKERQYVPQEVFYLNNQNIENKTVAIVDDVVVTGGTLKAAAETLWQGSPKKIYALTLCR